MYTPTASRASWWETVKRMLKEGTEIVTTTALDTAAEWHRDKMSNDSDTMSLDPQENMNQRNEILDTKEQPLVNAVMAYELALLIGDEKAQDQAQVTLWASIEDSRSNGQTDAQIYQHIAKIHQTCTMAFGINRETNQQLYQRTVGAHKENTPEANAIYSYKLALLQGDEQSLVKAKTAIKNCVEGLKSKGQSAVQIYQHLFTVGDHLNPTN